jgi:hypothetical protein
MLKGRLPSIRAIPPIWRRLETASDQKRAIWRVGELLYDALPGHGRQGTVGMEQRGPRVDRGVLGTQEEMGSH